MNQGQKVVFSCPDRDTGIIEPRVGELLFIGNETAIVRNTENQMIPGNAYPQYNQKVIGVYQIVFIVLHTPTGNVYKIYDEKNIRIYNEREKHGK